MSTYSENLWQDLCSRQYRAVLEYIGTTDEAAALDRLRSQFVKLGYHGKALEIEIGLAKRKKQETLP